MRAATCYSSKKGVYGKVVCGPSATGMELETSMSAILISHTSPPEETALSQAVTGCSRATSEHDPKKRKKGKKCHMNLRTLKRETNQMLIRLERLCKCLQDD